MNSPICCPQNYATQDYATQDYATESRRDRLWLLEHRWLALAYRLVTLVILATSGTGVLVVAWKAARWMLNWI